MHVAKGVRSEKHLQWKLENTLKIENILEVGNAFHSHELVGLILRK